MTKHCISPVHVSQEGRCLEYSPHRGRTLRLGHVRRPDGHLGVQQPVVRGVTGIHAVASKEGLVSTRDNNVIDERDTLSPLEGHGRLKTRRRTNTHEIQIPRVEESLSLPNFVVPVSCHDDHRPRKASPHRHNLRLERLNGLHPVTDRSIPLPYTRTRNIQGADKNGARRKKNLRPY